MANSKIEGEGSYTATRDYNERTKAFVKRKRGDIDALARDAADTLKGQDREDLKRAEAEGMTKAKS